MATNPRSRSADNGKLDATAWTEAALDVLATHGIDGVRVESLAKTLAVTKGSFYWHFKDRAALFESMLSLWRRRATLELIERLERDEGTPIARLHRLLRLPFVSRASPRAADVELAIHLWGRRDPRASAALEEVDQLRLRYISGLLVQLGQAPEDAAARAVLVYSYMRSAGTLLPDEASDLIKRCEDLVIGYAEPQSV